jgi:Fe-S-cluster containining protein
MQDTLHIPPFINYTCQTCGWCCHQYDITFSQADYDRLNKHDWGKLEPSLAGKEWSAPLRDRRTPDRYRLRYAADGACLFLQGDKCLMHKHVGELGKTLGCCVYPFTFVSTPTGVYVGCRFSCRAVAFGIGEPIIRREESLRRQLDLCEASGHVPRYGKTVVFSGRTTLPWTDYLELERVLLRVFLRDDLPLARRLYLAYKFLDILRQARLERVRGQKFRELVTILEAGLLQEAESEPLPEGANPLWRVMFRQFCFLFQRRQGGSYRELGLMGRLGVRIKSFRTGIRFATGAGEVELPAIDGAIDLKALRDVEVGRLNSAQELALSRFIAGKIYGKQHFGRLFFNYSLQRGLEFLLLSAGAVLWYARVLALARGDKEVNTDDVVEAIRYVDFCYGYSSAPGLILERLRVQLLSREDLGIRLVLSQYV